MDYVRFRHLASNLFDFFFEASDVKGQVEDPQHVGRDHTRGWRATTAVPGPLLHRQELVVPQQRTEQFQAVLEYFLQELFVLERRNRVMEQSHKADQTLRRQVSLR